MTPCACGKEAVVEKAGKSLCKDCKKNYQGREYPVRSGMETVRNFREMTTSERTPA